MSSNEVNNQPDPADDQRHGDVVDRSAHPRDRSFSRSPSPRQRRESTRSRRSRSRSYSRSRSPPERRGSYGGERRRSSPPHRGNRGRSRSYSRSRSRSPPPSRGGGRSDRYRDHDRERDYGRRDNRHRDDRYDRRGPPPPYYDDRGRRDDRGGYDERGRRDDYGPRREYRGGPDHHRYDGPPPRRGSSRDQRRRDDGVPGISLLVRNIGPHITNQDLGVAFGRIGDVRDVYIPRDYHTHKPKGFAFIEYANPEQAREARDEMDRFRIKGCELEVVFAQERRKSPNEMRSKSRRERSSSFERHQRKRQRDEDQRREVRGEDGGDDKDDGHPSEQK